MVQMMGAMYDYMKDYCVCDGKDFVVPMKTLLGDDVEDYPISVFNVNLTEIGVANSKEEYISVWNADADNKLVGEISGTKGPFLFVIKVKPGQSVPGEVIGDTGSLVPAGALEDQDGTFLIDSDGLFLIDL